MRALLLAGVSACAALEAPGEPIFSFDPEMRAPPRVHYAYHSGHFDLVYEVFVYPQQTICYLRSRDPRRISPRFVAGDTELADLCSPGPDRCAFPGEVGVRMAVLEALAERAEPSGPIEVHVYTHPDETASLEAATALAQARAHLLLPLIEAEGIAAEQIEVVAHGWVGAAERVIHSDFEDQQCDDLSLVEFAAEDQRDAFGLLDEPDADVVEEMRSRCHAAVERCRGSACVDSYDGLGWADILGDPTRQQRSELAVVQPFDDDWLSDLEARVAALPPAAAGQSPVWGYHISSVSIATRDHDVLYRAESMPEAARLLDTFFSAGVAGGCRFPRAPAATAADDDPRDGVFAPFP